MAYAEMARADDRAKQDAPDARQAFWRDLEPFLDLVHEVLANGWRPDVALDSAGLATAAMENMLAGLPGGPHSIALARGLRGFNAAMDDVHARKGEPEIRLRRLRNALVHLLVSVPELYPEPSAERILRQQLRDTALDYVYASGISDDLLFVTQINAFKQAAISLTPFGYGKSIEIALQVEPEMQKIARNFARHYPAIVTHHEEKRLFAALNNVRWHNDVRRVCSIVYARDDAESAYQAIMALHAAGTAPEAVEQALTDAPEQFGRLRGFALRGIKSPGRLDALDELRLSRRMMAHGRGGHRDLVSTSLQHDIIDPHALDSAIGLVAQRTGGLVTWARDAREPLKRSPAGTTVLLGHLIMEHAIAKAHNEPPGPDSLPMTHKYLPQFLPGVDPAAADIQEQLQQLFASHCAKLQPHELAVVGRWLPTGEPFPGYHALAHSLAKASAPARDNRTAPLGITGENGVTRIARPASTGQAARPDNDVLPAQTGAQAAVIDLATARRKRRPGTRRDGPSRG